MKKILLFIMSFVALGVYSQDVIVKKDGTTIISKILEVGTSEVKYKKFSNQDGPLFVISKSEILSINYENGEKDLVPSSETTDEQTSKSVDEDKVVEVPKEHKLPAGTQIPLQNINYLRASNLSEGKPVYFRTARDINIDGIDVIPYGTTVKGVVYEAKKSSWFGTKGRLGIKINEIELPSGLTIPLTNGNIYVTGKNRTTLSVLLCLFVIWPAAFICGSKAELPVGYELMTQVAAPVIFTEQGNRLVGKVMEIEPLNDKKRAEDTPVIIKLKGSGKIKAFIQSEDNDYYYYKKADKPNGKVLKIKKSKVKSITDIFS